MRLSPPPIRSESRLLTVQFAFRCRICCQWRNWLGVHWRNFIPTPQALHSWVWRGVQCRYRRGHERSYAVHGQFQPVELGPQDGLVLRRGRTPVHCRHVVADTGNQRVSWCHPHSHHPVFSAYYHLTHTNFSRRLSAAELDELFENKVKPWRFQKTQTATQRLVEIKKD